MGLEGLALRHHHAPAGAAPSLDDDLTNLNWLQDRDLLKNVTAGTSKARFLSEVNENRAPSHHISPVVPYAIPPVAYNPRVHVHAKPPYSFSTLIFMAIESSQSKALPVKEIYSWIQDNFPFYRSAPCGWKNTIRHNLSLSKCFKKVDKLDDTSPCFNSNAKGSLWSVDCNLRPSLLQSVKRASFHVYPYMSTSKTCLDIRSPQITRPVLFPAPKEVEAVESMLTLTHTNYRKCDEQMTISAKPSNDPSIEHNYSAKLALKTIGSPVTCSDRKILLPSQVIPERGESRSGGEREEKIPAALDGDDDGLKGAEVLFNFSKRRLSN